MPNFHYSFLVWNLFSGQSLSKTENLQKRALRLLSNDYDNMNLSRQGTLRIEIYKVLNEINPRYLNDIFTNLEIQTD